MSLYRCEQCGCVENTALANYWIRHDREDKRPLCSECDPDIGQWHGKFEKRSAIGMLVDQEGHLWSSRDQMPEHFEVTGIVTEKGIEPFEGPPPCQRQGCKAPGPFVPVICIPRKGCSPDVVRPIEFTIGLNICESHKKDVKASDFISRDADRLVMKKTGKVGLRRLAKRLFRHGPPPDFDRASVRFIRWTERPARIARGERTQ